MKVGDFIWNTWDNSILRYGTITSRKRAADKSAYAYYTVEWHDDSQYEASAMQDDDTTHREKKWYRIDELHHCETHHLERSVYLHKKTCMPEWVKARTTSHDKGLDPFELPDDPGGSQDDKFNF